MVLHKLQLQKQISINYHNKYDYPLSESELNKWTANFDFQNIQKIVFKNSFYFVEKKEHLIHIRKKREKYSKEKFLIAQKAASILSKNKYILFIGITGSLAMNNAKKSDDIDLMFIAKKNRLWIARFMVYLSLYKNKIDVRKPKSKKEKNKLCLNLWLDESNLSFENKKNEFIAHEIAQVIPLFNKDKTYEKWLFVNKWILDYWPNSVNIKKRFTKNIVYFKQSYFYKAFFYKTLNLLNIIFFIMQYFYMFPKITNEKVSLKKAEFHLK